MPKTTQSSLVMYFLFFQAMLLIHLFFRTSESEEEEEEWEPKSKISGRPRLPKKTEAKTKKPAAPQTTVAKKMVKKVAIKEEMVSVYKQETFNYCSWEVT